MHILDASALLAYLTREDKSHKVAGLFTKALDSNHPLFISSLNWAEVSHKIQGATSVAYWKQVREQLQSHPLQVVPLTQTVAESAAFLKGKYKLGLADAVAAALAIEQKAILVTKDFDFKAVEQEVKILWI